MFRKNDPFTYTVTGTLQGGDQQVIGLFSVEYQVAHYDDVQLSSGTVHTGTANPGVRMYLLNSTQRIKIYNPSGSDLRPQHDADSYENYPVLLNNSVQMQSQDGMTIDLTNFTPQTVNTQVQTAGTTGTASGTTNSSSSSNTVGSSVSQTNSYGVSVGFFGDALTGSVSAEHSTTVTNETSNTTGSESSRSANQESSSSASMSIKDWGAYCQVNPALDSPSWTFGQEFPWDAVQCRKTNGAINPKNPNQVQLMIPSSMLVRLYDGSTVFPPSHLAMFGINFISKAQWKVAVANGTPDVVNVEHTINYYSGSHSVPTGSTTAAVFLDSTPTVLSLTDSGELTHTLDLGVLGLAPIGPAAGPATVGFLPSKFSVPPIPAGNNTPPTAFRAYSTGNTLRATDTTAYPGSGWTKDTGFSASETALTASLGGSCRQLTMSLVFKVVDVAANYNLYMKHWKVGDTGVMLSIVINGDTANTLIKYVDSQESEGGENNLLSIALRNLDVTSADYHDYLTLGLNSIDITISPIIGTGPCTYQVRAVSVEAV